MANLIEVNTKRITGKDIKKRIEVASRTKRPSFGRLNTSRLYSITDAETGSTGIVFPFAMFDSMEGLEYDEPSVNPVIVERNNGKVNVSLEENNSLEGLCVDLDPDVFSHDLSKKSAAIAEYTAPSMERMQHIVTLALLAKGKYSTEGTLLRFVYDNPRSRAAKVPLVNSRGPVLDNPGLPIPDISLISYMFNIQSSDALNHRIRLLQSIAEKDGTITFGLLEKYLKENMGNQGDYYGIPALKRALRILYETNTKINYNPEKYGKLDINAALPSRLRKNYMTKGGNGEQIIKSEETRNYTSMYEEAIIRKIEGEVPFKNKPDLPIYHPEKGWFCDDIKKVVDFCHPTELDGEGIPTTWRRTNYDGGTEMKARPKNGLSEKRMCVNMTGLKLDQGLWGYELLPEILELYQHRSRVEKGK